MDHTRHLNIYNIPSYFTVGVIGGGGIGAMVALVLAKMGVVSLTVWDDDVISSVNIPTQLHRHADIDVPKVLSLQHTLEEFSDEIFFTPIQARVDEHYIFPQFNLLISAVDSIDARKAIWQAIKNSPLPSAYIDCRMSAEQYQHFAFLLDDRKAAANYEAMLMELNENDVPDEVCTMKSTFYTASLAAGHVGTAFRNLLRNKMRPHRLVHCIPESVLYTFDL